LKEKSDEEKMKEKRRETKKDEERRRKINASIHKNIELIILA